MKVTKKDPRWEIEEAGRRGEQAYRLLTGVDATDLAARVPLGTAEAFRVDVDALARARVDAVGTLRAQKGATAGKLEIGRQAHDLVMHVRNSVQRLAVGASQLHVTLGVGEDFRPRETVKVLANLGKIVELGGASHDGLVQYGVAVVDVEEAVRLAALLAAKQEDQVGAKGDRSGATRDRTRLHLRVETTIDVIGLAGIATYPHDPVRRAPYEALFASPASPPPSSPPTGTDPPVPALPPLA
ncbi:MAG TPA: hypothetical protein VG389_11815 [Myxococcota bacterium]|jgi:hypothetical protein|nr:hypothetical protein [Myxococcota bacterium]